MKKIFSYVLMATALLISGQVKAGNVAKVNIGGTETEYSTLLAAFTAANGKTATITMLDDATDMASTNFTFNGGAEIEWNLSTFTASMQKITLNGAKLNVTGNGVININGNSAIYLYGTTNPNEVDYSVVTIGENVTLNSLSYYAIGVMATGNCAYGTKVIVNGYVNSAYGITVLGTVNVTTGNVPEVYLNASSTVIGGLYCAGYAKYYLYGKIKDNGEDSPVYIKSGSVLIDGAEIIATGAYSAPKESGNGAYSGGTAIVIDSHVSYGPIAGITITGDTKLSATSGYAIEEVVTKGDEKLPTITIESGEFKGGTQGCIKTTEDVKNQILTNGTITGGTYSGSEIKNYISNGNGVIDVTTSGAETVYVVNGMPSGKTWVATIAAAQTADYVKIAADEEVASDKEIAYLNIPGANKVTVKSGAKLAVGEAVLGADAVIEVEAGAKLVVNGTNGLIAFETTNIILRGAAGEATGMFVLNPDVKANKQPWATLEYVSEAYSLGEGEYMWEMFTNPFASISTAARNPNQPSIFQHVVDGVFKNFAAWGTEGDVRSAEPFELIAITNTSDEGDQVTYTFTGQLQGSNDAVFSLKAGFNYLGNGYTALMNAKQVILGLQESSKKVRTLLYVWNVESQGWKCYNGYKLDELNNVNPLTAFVLYADEAAEVDMDYEELIWNVNK